MEGSDQIGVKQRTRGGIVKSRILARGTMASLNLDLSRRFYEELLGFECVRYARDGLLIRGPGDHPNGHRAGGPYWVIDVREVATLDDPQNVLNHWGLDVPTHEAVDQAHRMASEHAERFGLRKVVRPHQQHGQYAFYLQDRDSNWWEYVCSSYAERTRMFGPEAGYGG